MKEQSMNYNGEVKEQLIRRRWNMKKSQKITNKTKREDEIADDSMQREDERTADKTQGEDERTANKTQWEDEITADKTQREDERTAGLKSDLRNVMGKFSFVRSDGAIRFLVIVESNVPHVRHKARFGEQGFKSRRGGAGEA